jgi:Tol biopolymer transport system component
MENGCQIAIIDADGSNLREVPVEPGHTPRVDVCESDPSFTPDGRSIVYTRYDMRQTEEVWIMKVDGTDHRRVTDACAIDPGVSPDGTMLACKAPEGALWVVNMDGTGAKQVSPAMDIGYTIDWAPDGKTIVFVDSSETMPTGVNIATVQPDGTDLTYVTHYTEPGWYTGFGGYSPDGESIVYRLEHGPGEKAVVIMNADGSDPREVTDWGDFHPGAMNWGPAPTE